MAKKEKHLNDLFIYCDLFVTFNKPFKQELNMHSCPYSYLLSCTLCGALFIDFFADYPYTKCSAFMSESVESFTQPIRSKTQIHLVTKHKQLCAVLGVTQHFCCSFV